MPKNLIYILLILALSLFAISCEDSLGLDPDVSKNAIDIDDQNPDDNGDDDNGNGNDTIITDTTFRPSTIYLRDVIELYASRKGTQIPLYNYSYEMETNDIKIDTSSGNIKIKLDFVYINGTPPKEYLGDELLRCDLINRKLVMNTDYLKIDSLYVFNENHHGARSYVNIVSDNYRVMELLPERYELYIILTSFDNDKIGCFISLQLKDIPPNEDEILKYIGFSTRFDIRI